MWILNVNDLSTTSQDNDKGSNLLKLRDLSTTGFKWNEISRHLLYQIILSNKQITCIKAFKCFNPIKDISGSKRSDSSFYLIKIVNSLRRSFLDYPCILFGHLPFTTQNSLNCVQCHPSPRHWISPVGFTGSPKNEKKISKLQRLQYCSSFTHFEFNRHSSNLSYIFSSKYFQSLPYWLHHPLADCLFWKL